MGPQITAGHSQLRSTIHSVSANSRDFRQFQDGAVCQLHRCYCRGLFDWLLNCIVQHPTICPVVIGNLVANIRLAVTGNLVVDVRPVMIGNLVMGIRHFVIGYMIMDTHML